MSRPEQVAPADVYYNEEEAHKYTTNTHIIDVQKRMTERAIELLALPEDSTCFLLDIGCGSGLSGEELSENGHVWVGLDLSPSMLNVALEREVDGDLFLQDMGQGVGFRPGSFDGAISISALQWLCNADQRGHVPHKRLARFFGTLYAALARGARAVFQLYPQTPQQMGMITAAAMKAGFTGGLVVDFPNSTRAKKMFLCLFAGVAAEVPKGLDGTEGEDGQAGPSMPYSRKDRDAHFGKGKGKKAATKSRDWIADKKERRKRQGKDVRPDSAYSGRSRGPKF
ncbi:methyltransferase [Capsaspora owczarzaki ATCC 30864]|uniref:Methyltransferase n=1 Tax=Capsaspora owczarzaki (strain ATCC 30864) TaxID=595528 RepID=A0A0D2WH66_CAPO3|nr:methyltransferase [Capsaspora owczarzaki ATCC 30864]KJE88900.1 methyltransferase [Capsaspora owczarzaki ATCC 30864]|eukprot:XP_004365347.1 methyltransferase [Capsaspora owczarzaki ATCC 30864]